MILRPPISTLFPYTTLFRPRGNRRRSIQVTKLDIEVVRQRLKILLAQKGRRPRDVPRVRLLDGEGAGRPPLGLVRVEQRSEEHTSELQSRLQLVCRHLLDIN